MPDEIALQNQINRGVKARLLLDNDLLKEAFSSLEKDYTKALFLTKPEDMTAREKLYLAVNVVRKVSDHLTKVINDGKLAEADLSRMTAEIERKKRFGIM